MKSTGSPAREFQSAKAGARVAASRQTDGSWSATWYSSMGEEREKHFASDDDLEEWIRTDGAKRGYVELTNTPVAAVSKPPSRSTHRPLPDTVFPSRCVDIQKWVKATEHLYFGPDDRDFDLAFSVRFGMRWSDWEAELGRRGLLESAAPVAPAVISADEDDADA